MVSEMQAEEATYHFTGHKPALGPRRQAKKSNDHAHRLTTKEGERQLTAPHALRPSNGKHVVYRKGVLRGSLELRYHNGTSSRFQEIGQRPGDARERMAQLTS